MLHSIRSRFGSRRAAYLFILISAVFALWFDAHTPPLPHVDHQSAVSENSLRARVGYLASPGLRGRFPLLRGSSQARRFIVSEFAALGLRPWEATTGYVQPFAVGHNIVGVLPGTDPQLRDEYVLVSAHYDHVGGGNPGAADNASGVAAMLEIAERLSANPPRRSVCFAAFDAEEFGLVGAFAFSARPDVASARFAGVVNLDTLGRRFWDTASDALIVAGTKDFPPLQDAIVANAESQGLRLWPLGEDLIGPLGDHFAFRDREDIPVLFFTNGISKDYHAPGDTAANIDYDLLRRVTEAVGTTAERLANEARAVPQDPAPDSYRREMSAMVAALRAVLEHNPRLEPGTVFRPKMEGLLARVEERAAVGPFDEATRAALLNDTIKTFGPSLGVLLYPPALNAQDLIIPGADDPALVLRLFHSVLLRHQPTFVRSYRGILKAFFDRGLFQVLLSGLPLRQYASFHTCDSEISVSPAEDGQVNLNLLMGYVSIKSDVGCFGRLGDVFPFAGYVDISFKGSMEEVIDFCLLAWRTRHSAALFDVPVEEVTGFHEGWVRVLERVTRTTHGKSYKEWMAWRTSSLGVANEGEWLGAMARSDNSEIAALAFRAMVDSSGPRPDDFAATARDALLNPALSGKARFFALKCCCAKERTIESLLAVAQVVNDDTKCYFFPTYMLSPSYPFYDHPYMEYCRSEYDWFSSPDTLGEMARDHLKHLAKQDCGTDVEAWEACLQKLFDSNRP